MNEQNLHLASELRGIVTRLTKKLRKKAAAADDLSLTERSTIGLIFNHKTLLASELAVMENITTQSMSQIINHLMELGLIIKTPSETDKRKVFISLSPLGTEMIEKTRTEKDEWLNKMLSENFTDEERALLSKAIAPLTRLADMD